MKHIICSALCFCVDSTCKMQSFKESPVWMYVAMIRISVSIVWDMVRLWVLFHLPVYGPRSLSRIHRHLLLDKTPISKQEFKTSLFSFQFFKQEFRSRGLDMHMKVSLNGKMYNANLLQTDGTPCKLADFLKPGRPLVINFGSCS